MAREAKAHRSLRFDNDVLDGVMRLKEPDETFTHAVNRLLAVGIRATDSGTQEHAEKHETPHKGTETEHEEHTAQYVKFLEEFNARLVAEHEADRAIIAEKDKQLSKTLDKALELAEQANVLARISQEKALPATTADEIAVVMDGEQIAQETADETPVEEKAAEPEKEPDTRGFWARFFS